MPLPHPEANSTATHPGDKGAKERPSLTSLHFELARALPPLWNKASDKNLTAKEQHKKLLELIIWVAGKQGYGAKQRYPIQYWQNHVKKDGRIDLMLHDSKGAPALLIELDWAKNESSIHKLQAASILKIPVLWVSGVRCSTKDEAKLLRFFANEATAKPTGWWLPLFHLNHGWL